MSWQFSGVELDYDPTGLYIWPALAVITEENRIAVMLGWLNLDVALTWRRAIL